MAKSTTIIAFDQHAATTVAAVLLPGQRTPALHTLTSDSPTILRFLQRLRAAAIQCCYEAGPCGYALQRQLTTERVSCQVVAPALIPRKPADHIKTNRRDARKLAELLRAGLLTEVAPPTAADEAVRDLARARDDVREDLVRARHRLSKLLLRRGVHFAGSHRAWSEAHRRWVRSLTWDYAADRRVADDYLLAIEQLEARRTELDAALEEIAQTEPYRTPVAWLRCFRGIDTLTAVIIVAELHDFRRFHSARALMAYLGLVPSEHSSGEHARRGRITKAGNAFVRRVLIEAAWHYQHRPGVGRGLRGRQAGQPSRVIAIADRAQQRLCRRFRRLVAEHKPTPKVAVAVARELAGFIWAALQDARPQAA